MTRTVRESVISVATHGAKALTLSRIFIAFAAHARKSYQYNAVKLVGSEGHTLLDRDENEIVTVDCASLADALKILLNELFPDQEAKTVKVHNGIDGFATSAASRCFDTAIVGNVRRPGETFAQTSRCVFMDHYFVATGDQTRQFLDPCMFTGYSTMNEVRAWNFEGGGGQFSSIVKKVQEDPRQLLIRIPQSHPGVKPKGFNSAFIIFQASDFKADEYKALWGFAKSGWKQAKFDTQKQAALDRINRLLSERAGVKVKHAFT